MTSSFFSSVTLTPVVVFNQGFVLSKHLNMMNLELSPQGLLHPPLLEQPMVKILKSVETGNCHTITHFSLLLITFLDPHHKLQLLNRALDLQDICTCIKLYPVPLSLRNYPKELSFSNRYGHTVPRISPFSVGEYMTEEDAFVHNLSRNSIILIPCTDFPYVFPNCSFFLTIILEVKLCRSRNN